MFATEQAAWVKRDVSVSCCKYILTCCFFTDAFSSTVNASVLIVGHKRNVAPARLELFMLVSRMLKISIGAH